MLNKLEDSLFVVTNISRAKTNKVTRIHFQQALRIYQSGTDEEFRQGEIARTSDQMGQVFEKLGRTLEAKSCNDLATQIKERLIQARNLEAEISYDQLVSCWVL